MNKVLLSILAGATMLSSVASASPSLKIDATDLVLPTGDQVISDLYIQNTGGINNVSLSKYEQAWMIVHDKDTMFKHKTFWVRSGKVFTGIAVDSIKDLTKSERSEFIMDSVKKSVVEAALKEELDNLKVDHAKAIADLAEAGKNIEMLTIAANKATELAGQIEEITAGIEALKTAHTVAIEKATAEARQAGIDSVDKEHNVRVIGGQLTKDGYIGININKDITADDIINVGEKIKEAYTAGINITQDSLKADLVSTFNLTFTNSMGEVIPTEKVGLTTIINAIEAKTNTITLPDNVPALDIEKLRGLAHSNPVADEKRDFTAEPVNQNDRDAGEKYGESKTPNSIPSVDAAVSSVDTIEPLNTTSFTVSIDDREITINVSSLDPSNIALVEAATNAGFADGFEQGFAEGYEAGYDDGYQDGYADGYTDGFNDGVASVR